MNAAMTFQAPGKRPAFLWYPKDAITDNCRALNCEAYGLYMRMLEHSWINDGIPADLEFLEDLAKNAFGLSKYKFHKIWPKLKNFFQEIDGVLINSRLERERSQASEFRAKQREKSKIANRVRWGSQPVQAPLDYPNPISEQSPRGSSGDHPGIPEPSLSTPTRNKEGVPAASASPPTPSSEEAAEAGSPLWERLNGGPNAPSSLPEFGDPVPPETAIEALTRPFTDSDHEAIAIRSAELGLHAPDRKTAEAIIRRFPMLEISTYPRFPNQNSPGLWLHKTGLDMKIEIARQSVPVPRKPTEREQADQELLAWAREKDRKAAKA